MRAAVVLLIGFQFFAPAAWAETQVKAEDCSSAVSGTLIGSHIEVHCLSKEDIARVIDELVRQGVVKRAEDAGIETSVVVSLAARLKPTQKLDFAQAVVEVSHAVDIAMTVVAEGSSGSSDQLVDEALRRIAEKTKANDAAGATREAEEGFARWEKQETERRASALASGVALLEAALNTDLLRFDAAAAAGRVEKIASLQHEDDPKALFDAVRSRQDQFDTEGRDKGVNFSLQVAIAIARREVELARGPDQHGVALNDLGIALEELGERESGPARLEEAVQAYRAALEERTRERVPLDWAMTQTNLGAALRALGERESGTARLEEAVQAYRAALEEWTRERVPLQWAATQNNLGNALLRLGERETGTARLEEAVAAYRAALEEWTRERVPLDWAATQNNLGSALLRLGERETGTARLEEAVAACRAALEEYTRERVPLDWAMTENNLGAALETLGERVSGTAELEAAVQAYRAALEEWTRERVPLDWAAAQDNLGNALQTLGERESGTARLEEAVEAHRAALEEYTRERVPLDWAASLGNQGVAFMLIAERNSDGAKADAAVRQIETAYEAERSGGQEARSAIYRRQLLRAQAIRDRLKGK
jgi:tetratricopeptide (TPR) repeat protein